jgi:low affinity Fe/Cu permease
MTFADITRATSKAAGHPVTFCLAVLSVLVWAGLGPWYHWSEEHSLAINTGTTIVTFLLVFVLQNSQNRDGAAIQTKLDELLRASTASNRYVGCENATEADLEALRKRCTERAANEPDQPIGELPTLAGSCCDKPDPYAFWWSIIPWLKP